jgi:hypothetical protein
MGRTEGTSIWHLLRAWTAGTVVVLSPLLLLEDLDSLLKEFQLPVMFWRDWMSLPISAAIGAAAALVDWTLHGRILSRLEVFAQRVTRHMLFMILSIYAVSKVLRIQFRVPYSVLDTPIGDVSGYMLAWRFFGYSHAHEVFVALAEWFGPLLLLYWRTTTLGACITAVVLSNVVAVNFTHNLPVQRFSSCLLALAIYVLLFDAPRLLDFFVLNRPVEPRLPPAPLIRSPLLTLGFKAGWVALALVYSFGYLALGDSRMTPLTGSWTVADRGMPPAVGWKTICFERAWRDHYPGSVRQGDDSKPKYFQYELDAASGHVRITFPNNKAAAENFDGIYEFGGDGRVRLHGALGEQAVEIQLVRKR